VSTDNGTVYVPPGHIVWQAHCDSCGSRYVVVATYQEDAPSPSFCAICGAGASHVVLMGEEVAV
jgi:hypothetical protein